MDLLVKAVVHSLSFHAEKGTYVLRALGVPYARYPLRAHTIPWARRMEWPVRRRKATRTTCEKRPESGLRPRTRHRRIRPVTPLRRTSRARDSLPLAITRMPRAEITQRHPLHKTQLVGKGNRREVFVRGYLYRRCRWWPRLRTRGEASPTPRLQHTRQERRILQAPIQRQNTN